MTDMPRPMKKHWERTLGGKSTANHTPGPWEAHRYKDEYWEIYCRRRPDEGKAYDGSHNKEITRLSGASDADAQLISAAPELLQALLEALQRYEGFPQTAVPKWVYKARKAIGKAGATPLPQPRREMD